VIDWADLQRSGAPHSGVDAVTLDDGAGQWVPQRPGKQNISSEGAYSLPAPGTSQERGGRSSGVITPWSRSEDASEPLRRELHRSFSALEASDHFLNPPLLLFIEMTFGFQSSARRFAFASCTGVKREETRLYPDWARWWWIPAELVVARRNQTQAFT
jgi:hypothetical protein